MVELRGGLVGVFCLTKKRKKNSLDFISGPKETKKREGCLGVVVVSGIGNSDKKK